MGRPSKFDRNAAVETAIQTFSKKGYGQTSVSDLAQAMAITRSSFYNSFGSRDKLFTEALTRYLSDEPDAPLKAAMTHGSVADGLYGFFANACRSLENAPDHCGCLVINSYVCTSRDGPIPAGVQTFINSRATQFATLITRAVDNREIAPVADAAIAADAMLAFLIGLNIMGRVPHPDGYLFSVAAGYLQRLGFHRRH